MKITRVETDLLRVPLPRPVALPAAQDPRTATTADVVLVRVLTDGGPTGLGFAYTLGGGGAAVRSLIETVIADVVVGHDPAATEWLYLKGWAELEGLGFAGLAARAYAAVDFALWDWKGKAAGLGREIDDPFCCAKKHIPRRRPRARGADHCGRELP